MLKKEVDYSYYRLKKTILVNRKVLVKEIYIDPYWKKHQKEGISEELIIKLVKLLNNRRAEEGKRYDDWVYFVNEPWFYDDKAYCLVWCLEDNQNYLEVVDCYRASNYEKNKKDHEKQKNKK